LVNRPMPVFAFAVQSAFKYFKNFRSKPGLNEISEKVTNAIPDGGQLHLETDS
jgi:hypothetical protein